MAVVINEVERTELTWNDNPRYPVQTAVIEGGELVGLAFVQEQGVPVVNTLDMTLLKYIRNMINDIEAQLAPPPDPEL